MLETLVRGPDDYPAVIEHPGQVGQNAGVFAPVTA
jgi:hypothetical protein